MTFTLTSTTTTFLRRAQLCRPYLSSNIYSSRRYSTASDTVQLEYDLFAPSNGNTKEQPLVILHGLFGSKRNWGSLCKAFLRDLQRPIYALDLRNHGTSPHAAPMTYEAMAADVLRFFEEHSLQEVSLLGHSMGGKTAMTLALQQSPRLSNLIVADIAPARGPLSAEFRAHVNAMQRIEEKKVQTRREAEDMLAEHEQDTNVRLFLLTNFIAPDKNSPSSSGRFRVPLDIISESITAIGDFPFEPSSGASWPGRTLFIKGSRSKYINKYTLPPAEALFPQMYLETLDAGHWVHSERPKEFSQLVKEFITKN